MSFDACAELVRRGDPERFRAVMAAPPALRGPLFAVYAFNLEVARAPWVTGEPMIAEMRLQWWKDALDDIESGGAVRRHEVVEPLAECLPPSAVAPLQELIEARRTDISTEPFQDHAEIDAYLSRTAGNLLMVAGQAALGQEQGSDVLRKYGRAAGVATWLCALPEMQRHQRHRLPTGHGRDLLIDIARNALDDLRDLRTQVSREETPIARAGWMATARLRAIIANPDCLEAEGPEFSDFRTRGSLLLKSLTGSL